MMNFLAISGSLRNGSYNSSLLSQAAEVAGDIRWAVGEIGDLPLYNEDIDGTTKPHPVQRLLDQTAKADALVIASPEYNYGVPGGLKNALDWLSRPAYQSVLRNKPTLLLSASMSPIGGVRGQAQLKQILSGTLTPVFPAPEFYIASAQKHFDSGRLTDEKIRERLQSLLQDFSTWVKNAPN